MTLETEHKTLQCPENLPNLCVGSACAAWEVFEPRVEKWHVFAGTTEASMLPKPAPDASATIKRPADTVAKLWVWSGDKAGYDLWTHSEGGILRGQCLKVHGP